MFAPIKVEVVNHFFHGLRTNNHVEAWHLGMKKIKLEKSRHNFFEIIYVMQKKQAITNMKLNQFFGCILSKILYKHVNTSFVKNTNVSLPPLLIYTQLIINLHSK